MTKPTLIADEDDAACTTLMSLPNSSLVTTKLQEVITTDNGSSLADVIFITSDEKHIPAVRILLAMSSSYFQKLFSSEFAEKSLAEVPISISSLILQEILEFIHTDDCNRLRTVRNSVNESVMIPCKIVQGLVELADAADYTCIERLVSRCEEGVKCVMTRAPHTACAAVRALAQGRSSWGTGLLQEAVKTTVSQLEDSLVRYDGCDLTCGLMHLDARAAEDVFSCVKTEDSEHYKLFQALVVWASGGTALQLEREHQPWSHTELILDTDEIKVTLDRLESAKGIAKWFDVSSFNPGFLANVVEVSGLVDHHVLRAAYKRQSILLEEDVKHKEETICTTSEEQRKAQGDLALCKMELAHKSEELKNITGKLAEERMKAQGNLALSKKQVAHKSEELKKVTGKLTRTSGELACAVINLESKSRELEQVKRELEDTLSEVLSCRQELARRNSRKVKARKR